jgi:hypothetical protein
LLRNNGIFTGTTVLVFTIPVVMSSTYIFEFKKIVMEVLTGTYFSHPKTNCVQMATNDLLGLFC